MDSNKQDPYPTVTIVSNLKDRLKIQQATIHKVARDEETDWLNIRSELDALWECVEAISQIVDGISPEQAIIHDYFSDSKQTRRHWWTRRGNGTSI